MEDKIKLYVCESFKKEFEMIKENLKYNIEVFSFPSYCTYHQKIKKSKFIKGNLENIKNSICICGRFCELQKELPENVKKDVKFYNLDNCLYIFSKNKVDKHLKERAYIITPWWVEKWKENILSYGFDRKTAQRFYKESFKKIILFDTKTSNKIEEKLKAFSDYILLPYFIEEIELDYLEILVSKILNDFILENEIKKKEEEIKALDIEKSNYIAVLNMIKDFSELESKEMIINGIINQVKIFFAPKNIQYIEYDGEDILSGEKYEIIRKNKGFIVKLEYGKKIFGYIKCEGFLFPQYFDRYLNFMLNSSNIYGLMISNSYMLEQNKILSITDHLTGIYNRRYFEIRLKEEIERAKRTKNIFSLMLFDIDNFKMINDNYGHKVGDEILKKLVELIKSRIRKTDIFFRWGGDEFAIILPHTKLKEAKVLAEELRKTIYKTDFGINNRITCSFGITSYDQNTTFSEIVKKVDCLMYRAKKDGRNKICNS
ncbi:diguanylate cyclase (GGDEF) domain-containing protein [Marinitoga hydrogenitolerans DSM 16785]|uniref:Diguanylate cyclase (GGDEF) domain-containing protein n=1 Tax=Marinitoga hydrogenitolerans (strain DSM 16785 / JCM 12826 / AT1271) TaxID=1122195 RepID=A0A1M4Y9V7_MARH1|nr:diguanylate cyclase [Marinitoga hydrogenitolerans]SHF02524.1 diguanylate cyclase (GGDEF) domain-containing protein [Marinitoga hydrogenitolerans DSM 16785]